MKKMTKNKKKIKIKLRGEKNSARNLKTIR